MKSLISFPAVDLGGGPAIKVTHFTEGDRKNGSFHEEHCITCKSGNRSFCLKLRGHGRMDHVVNLEIQIQEKDGDKASANFWILAKSYKELGVSWGTANEFNGAVEEQEKLSCPPMKDVEVFKYSFTDPKLGSCLFMDKKNNNADIADRLTATHCFSIGEDAVYYVTIKIAAAGSKGLSAEVEGPVKRRKDFVEQQFSKLTGKIERKMEQQFRTGLMGDEDLKLPQASNSYVNTGKQRQKGMINSNGILRGIGNGGLFNNCKISVRKT